MEKEIPDAARPTGDVVEQFSDASNEFLYFLLQDKDHEFAVGLSDLLEFLKFAENAGYVPEISSWWWERMGELFPNLRSLDVNFDAESGTSGKFTLRRKDSLIDEVPDIDIENLIEDPNFSTEITDDCGCEMINACFSDVREIAQILYDNTMNVYLKLALYDFTHFAADYNHLYPALKRIKEDGYDMQGFMLWEIPAEGVFCFKKSSGESDDNDLWFDIYTNDYFGGGEPPIIGYLRGDKMCEARTIAEAIEKYDW